eukprot:9494655-Pyramimonas_sp.AAC.1
MGARPGGEDRLLSDDEQGLRPAGCAVACAAAGVVGIDALVSRAESGVNGRQVQVRGYSRLSGERGAASMGVAVGGRRRALMSLLRACMKYGLGR